MKFSIENFLNICDQIRRKLRIWSHLVKKSLRENFIFWCSAFPHISKPLFCCKKGKKLTSKQIRETSNFSKP